MPDGTKYQIIKAGESRTSLMSDNSEYKDRDNIDTLNDAELAKQAKELKITPEVLKDTANKVGVLKEDVKQQLGK
jgi:hypothetical protein